MPMVAVAQWPPPVCQTVLTKAGGVLLFAARNRDGSWVSVPLGRAMARPPEFWFCKVALKGMVAPECFAVPAGQRGQLDFTGLFGSSKDMMP